MTSSQIWRALPVLAVLLSLVGAGPLAMAEEKDSKDKNSTIQMEAVALPVIVDGALINYVFVSIKLELQPKADGAAVRNKEQFLRDDLVRVGHRTPFTRPDDYTKVDEAKVRAEVLRSAVKIVGPNVIKNAMITKQVSQKMINLPKATPQKGPPIVP